MRPGRRMGGGGWSRKTESGRMVPLRISAVLGAWRPSSGRKAKYQEIQITSFARRRRYRAVPDCCILATHLIGPQDRATKSPNEQAMITARTGSQLDVHSSVRE